MSVLTLTIRSTVSNLESHPLLAACPEIFSSLCKTKPIYCYCFWTGSWMRWLGAIQRQVKSWKAQGEKNKQVADSQGCRVKGERRDKVLLQCGPWVWGAASSSGSDGENKVAPSLYRAGMDSLFLMVSGPLRDFDMYGKFSLKWRSAHNYKWPTII